MFYLEGCDSGEDQVGECLPYCHACPCLRGHQALDGLLADGCGSPLETEGGQGHHGNVSQRGVQRPHTLLLGNQTSHRAVHLRMT